MEKIITEVIMIIKKELKWLVVCVELMIPKFQKRYMNGNWREEDVEDVNQCIGKKDIFRILKNFDTTTEHTQRRTVFCGRINELFI